MKKSSTNYFDQSHPYQLLKRLIQKQCDEKTSAFIWHKAGKNYRILMKRYKNVPKGETRHLYNTILPRMAMYKALQEKMTDQEAMTLLDKTVKSECTKVGTLLRKITALPGMSRLFMWLFSKMIKNMFGSKNGFKQVFHENSPSRLRVDILQCPYCKYCVENDCPELIHTFCDSDVYCYGNLSHIRFERTQTLGTGGDYCDFKFTRE